jgi:hypothetical protein
MSMPSALIWARIDEGTPFTVPAGKSFVLTALGTSRIVMSIPS